MLIRRANYKDLDGIYRIMDSIDHPMFFKDDREYVYNHIENDGFILVIDDKELIAYLMVHYVDYDEDVHLHHIAYMDSVGVLSFARGQSYMKRLIIKAEEILSGIGYYHYMATVHPDNIYSLRVLQDLGYDVVKKVYRYADLERLLLLKNEEITLR